MSLKVGDLNLAPGLRDVVDAVRSSELTLIERRDLIANDFEPEDHIYEVLMVVPAFGVRQLTSEQVNHLFGAVDAAMVRCTIATPEPPRNKWLRQGLFAVLNFSDGVAIYKGIVERVQPKISSLWYVYINTSHVIDFDPEHLGVIL